MKVIHDTGGIQVIHGDCLDVLRELPDASVDAVVTDPPYGLEFMGKEWDRLGDIGQASHQGFTDGSGFKGFRLPTGYNASANVKCQTCGRWRYDHVGRKCECGPDAVWPNVRAQQGRAMQDWHYAWAVECLRVLKPGGHLLAFGGTRTFHRLTCAIEDAGFEIRDSIGDGRLEPGLLAWVYGSGFPKSLNVGKAIDKGACIAAGTHSDDPDHECPATPEGEQWRGWGTALKPGWEPVVVARKPLAGTVAQNVLIHGTGALNIDATRIGAGEHVPGGGGFKGGATSRHEGWTRPSHVDGYATEPHTSGRWPANVVLDESQAAALDQMSGERPGFSGGGATPGPVGNDVYGDGWVRNPAPALYGDLGGASRFFYTAKASSSERIRLQQLGENDTILGGPIGKVCTKCQRQKVKVGKSACACAEPDFQPDPRRSGHVSHPTVKPLSLMRWLIRLVTPPGGTVLDPFAGSGTTAEACILEGFRCILIEREADYLPLIVQRVNRQRDPIAYTATAGEDLGLFGLLDDPT